MTNQKNIEKLKFFLSIRELIDMQNSNFITAKPGNIMQKKLELEREVATRKRKVNPLQSLRDRRPEDDKTLNSGKVESKTDD